MPLGFDRVDDKSTHSDVLLEPWRTVVGESRTHAASARESIRNRLLSHCGDKQ